MSRPCRVCRHKDCARLELECASGRSLASIAEEFGLKKDSTYRHWKKHVTPIRRAELIGGPVMVMQLAKRATEEDRSLLDYLSILRSELLHLFLSAKQRGMTYDAASIAQKLLNTLESIGRLNGQLRQAGITINNTNTATGPTIILNDPQVVKLQSAIIRALASYPEARAAVVAALRNFETKSSPMPMNGAHAPHEPLMIEANV